MVSYLIIERVTCPLRSRGNDQTDSSAPRPWPAAAAGAVRSGPPGLVARHGAAEEPAAVEHGDDGQHDGGAAAEAVADAQGPGAEAVDAQEPGAQAAAQRSPRAVERAGLRAAPGRREPAAPCRAQHRDDGVPSGPGPSLEDLASPTAVVHVAKLADFGASKRVEALGEDRSVLSGLKGTPRWMAPEVIKGQVGCNAMHGWVLADVWSMGCTFVEMVTGEMPWPMFPNPMAAMYHIADGTNKAGACVLRAGRRLAYQRVAPHGGTFYVATAPGDAEAVSNAVDLPDPNPLAVLARPRAVAKTRRAGLYRANFVSPQPAGTTTASRALYLS